MAETPEDASERLDSWKAIATYLHRDERTLRRWERELGLPIRRVRGPRGASVFAYKSEVDAWLQSALPPGEQPIRRSTEPPAAALGRRRWAVAAGLLIVGASVAVWMVAALRTFPPPARVEMTPSGVVAFDASGAERWRYRFPLGERFEPVGERATPVEILAGAPPAVFVGSQVRVDTATDLLKGGQLLWLTARGALQRTFAFEDRLTFGAGDYGPPWAISDFRVDEHGGERRVAVAGHHAQWWPSVVAVLDDQWRRRATFVHAGWIERVHWLSPDRLLVSGFSEALDGGVVAILDVNAMDGQPPVEAGSKFACPSCGMGRPLKYIVLPRSEVNRVTVSRFNRARLQPGADRIVVRTVEVPAAEGAEGSAVDALYEFSPALDLLSASYSERYWDVHRALEAQGKLDHTRAQCPEKDGPRAIQVWEPKTGWRTQKTR